MIWVAYLQAVKYSMKDAVWINIDETPIKMHFSGQRGTLLKTPGPKLKDKQCDRASLNLKRSQYTLMAAIASCSDTQQRLPQVLIPDHKKGKKWNALAHRMYMYPNIKLLLK